jgi:K+-sensing histidine kinase KdpD
VLKADDGSMLPEERQHICELINNGGQQLLYFINEILELSNIEGHELQLKRSEVTLDKVMQVFADEIRPKVAEGVTVRVEGQANHHVFVDEQMMRFVTMHFLENAARHTEKGTITLIYRLQNNQMYIAVKDTGHGVPEELRMNIFNLLSDKATYTQSAIPGLGLTICKTIVERCGGQIGLEQLAEGGSLFWHTVPVKVIKTN